MTLQDYRDVVGAVAAIVTYLQMFSGVFLCRDIYKRNSTDNIPVMPFLGGLVITHWPYKNRGIVLIIYTYFYYCEVSTSKKHLAESVEGKMAMETKKIQRRLGVRSILFYQHALLINDSTMNIVNVGGVILNALYLLFYFLWTPEKKKSKFYADVGKGIALVTLLLLYVQIEDPKKVELRFGMIVTILLLSLIASPLFSLGEVIRTQSTESLPFPMIVSGFVVSASWLLYGIIIKNNFVIFQNVTGTLICVIQLSLFAIYPCKPTKGKKDK